MTTPRLLSQDAALRRGTTLLRATRAHIVPVAILLADILSRLPHAAWLVPDPGFRRRILTDYAALIVEHAITSEHGHVDIISDHDLDPHRRTATADLIAAAVWLYHDDDGIPPLPHRDLRLHKACGRFAPAFTTAEACLQRHDLTVPHHHLAALVVHPARRRQGLGTALIRSHLPRLTTAGMTTYAPAATRPARDFYASHGLKPQQPFPLPAATTRRPAGAPIWPCTGIPPATPDPRSGPGRPRKAALDERVTIAEDAATPPANRLTPTQKYPRLFTG